MLARTSPPHIAPPRQAQPRRLCQKHAFVDHRGSKPCKHGHTSGRKANGKCLECHRLWEKERYRANPDVILERRTNRPVAPSQTPESRRKWNKNNPEKVMLHHARMQAKRAGYECNLTVADIIIPKFCPLLGITIEQASGIRTDASPSLDKIIPKLGYVRGNVWVVSWRANKIKSDATVNELQLLASNLAKAVHRYPWEAL